MLTLKDLDLSNRKFWTGFFASAFPTALDEKSDMSLSEMIEEKNLADISWWNKFTKYYDGVFEEADGYVDDPEMLVCELDAAHTLKIEFHPGDTVYYVNDKQIACTGGEYNIGIFPFADLLKYSEEKNDARIFLLFLPLTVIGDREADNAAGAITNALKEVFNKRLCKRFANSIVYGLTEE